MVGAFSYDCKTLRKFPSGFTEFGTYSRVNGAVAVPSRRVDSHIPLSLAIPMTTQWESFRRRLSLRVLHPVSFRFVESVGRIINVR
jgi:hypothetical protein